MTPDRSFKVECGYRYRFTTRGSVDSIVDFYARQARENRLVLAKDTRDQFPYTRMLGFDEKGGVRLLFVQIERKVGVNTATVTFRTRKAAASCN
ncbi:hypothetical protein [Novosphingobium sp. 9]|uniref:hypothetical protein n=1 Tax=Novosphingobium sp. 9 TaxID=2025349 RepID=UPI0021B6D792|nr:hypothetical protein [Novosphingobium sp. 9]